MINGGALSKRSVIRIIPPQGVPATLSGKSVLHLRETRIGAKQPAEQAEKLGLKRGNGILLLTSRLVAFQLFLLRSLGGNSKLSTQLV